MVKLLALGLFTVLSAVSFAIPNPAINRVDVANHKHHATVTSSSMAPRVTLENREPAINRVDAVVHAHHKLTTSSAQSSSFQTLIKTTVGPQVTLNPRDPAVNRVDAVKNGGPAQTLFSFPGGTPVTLAVKDVEELEAVA